MKKLCAIMFLCATLSCVSVRTQLANMADKEFQARETAKHVIHRALGKEPWKSRCNVNYNLMPPIVEYLPTKTLVEACKVEESDELNVDPINGCYDEVGNRIYVKDGWSWGPGHENVLRSQFKTLVHEYLHFYVLANKLSPQCSSELVSRYGTWAGTESIIFYRFSL